MFMCACIVQVLTIIATTLKFYFFAFVHSGIVLIVIVIESTHRHGIANVSVLAVE